VIFSSVQYHRFFHPALFQPEQHFYRTRLSFYCNCWCRFVAILVLKGVWHEIFVLRFFHESVSPRPLCIPLWPFQIFRKIRTEFATLCFSPMSKAPAISCSAVSTTPLNYWQCFWHRWLNLVLDMKCPQWIRKFEMTILRDPGETESWKKPEVKNLVSDSL